VRRAQPSTIPSHPGEFQLTAESAAFLGLVGTQRQVEASSDRAFGFTEKAPVWDQAGFSLRKATTLNLALAFQQVPEMRRFGCQLKLSGVGPWGSWKAWARAHAISAKVTMMKTRTMFILRSHEDASLERTLDFNCADECLFLFKFFHGRFRWLVLTSAYPHQIADDIVQFTRAESRAVAGRRWSLGGGIPLFDLRLREEMKAPSSVCSCTEKYLRCGFCLCMFAVRTVAVPFSPDDRARRRAGNLVGICSTVCVRA